MSTENKEVVKNDHSDIFITEKDTFDIGVKYYKKDGVVMVEGVDDEFDSNVGSQSFTVTFKYPDQGDTTKISAQASGLSSNPDAVDIKSIMNLEFARFLCLIRKWSIDKEINNKNILSMHPKIIRSLIYALRTKLGMESII